MSSVGYFRDLYATSAVPTGETRENLLIRIKDRISLLIRTQGMYQPVFGLKNSLETSDRQEHLISNCAFVEHHFAHVIQKSKVRILDVGCNAGYTTFTLAKTFPQIIGFETNELCLALCKDLAEFNQSSAKFLGVDLMGLLDTHELDLVNVDCVLLFNVVHQLIFARGLPYIKTFLRRLTQAVDVTFVELATRASYVSHRKDHLLPIDPEEVLCECTDCEIQLLRRAPRPFYVIKRKKLRLSGSNFYVNNVDFSPNIRMGINRKYYFNVSRILKVYRFTPHQSDKAYHSEVEGLLKVREMSIAPRILDWSIDAYSGSILMERIYGPSLKDLFRDSHSALDKDHIVAQFIRIAASLFQAGIYQNDLTAQNFVMRTDGSLILLDFEQTRNHALWDHFGFFLWFLNDLNKRKLESYQLNAYRDLKLDPPENRVRNEFYPKISHNEENTIIREIIEDAWTVSNWGTFVEKWKKKFEMMYKK